MQDIRILVTSLSRKVPLIKSLRKAMAKLEQRVILVGGDTDANCIGRHFVDEFWHMPCLGDFNINNLLHTLKDKRINYIIPTRDAELMYFSQYLDLFNSEKIQVMVSDSHAIASCIDKYEFFLMLQSKGLPVVETALSIEKLVVQKYVVKERYGAGSRKLGLNLAKSEALRFCTDLEEAIFQPFIQGIEYSVDAYIDRRGTVKGLIIRTRDLVLNGESQISRSVVNEQLECLSIKTINALQLYGHCILQFIADDAGNFHLIECNGRFGGASTLSQELGLESFYWFILEGMGENLDNFPFRRSAIEKCLIRYSQDLFI